MLFNVFCKATVHKFCLFVAICHCVENLALQAGAELSLLCGLYSGTASAWMNLMFWGECVAVSHHAGVNQTLSNHRFYNIWNIWPKPEFSLDIVIWTSNKSARFVLLNWGKKHYNKSNYQWWCNLTIVSSYHIKACKLLLLLNFILKLLMLTTSALRDY